MAAAKLLETRGSRDLTVLVFIAWFLLYAALLRNQGLLQLPWLLGSAFLSTVALMRVHAEAHGGARDQPARDARCALLLQAVPVAIAAVPAVPAAARPVLGHRHAAARPARDSTTR